MEQIEQIIAMLRKRFAIPNLLICIGILFFLGKLFLIWFGSSKQLKVELADIDSADKNSFFQKSNISPADFEIIPEMNLFRPSRAEWIPPVLLSSSPPPPPPALSPPPSPPAPLLPPFSPPSSSPSLATLFPSLLSSPPTPIKPVPSPVIFVRGIIEGGEFTKRAIFEGKYFSQPNMEKKKIKKKAYKLHERIGHYRVEKIDSDKVVLTDLTGKSYEFFMKKKGSKKIQLFSKPKKVTGKKGFGTTHHISGTNTVKPAQKIVPHISGAKTTTPQHISGNGRS